MPAARTYDAIKRTGTRLVYLGPQDYPLPWLWTYGQWGITTVGVVGLDLGTGFGLNAIGASWVVIVIALLWSTAAAVIGTSLIYRKVSPDRPARAVVRTLATDWRTTNLDTKGPRQPIVLSSSRIFAGGDQ
jgi:hypothetical protein